MLLLDEFEHLALPVGLVTVRALLVLIPRQRANAGDDFFTRYTVLYIVFTVRRCVEERKGIKDTSYLHAWKRKYCTPEGGAVPYTFLVLS